MQTSNFRQLLEIVTKILVIIKEWQFGSVTEENRRQFRLLYDDIGEWMTANDWIYHESNANDTNSDT